MENPAIIKRLQIIEELLKELNILKETYQDALDNDADYQKVQEEEAKVKDEFRQKKVKITSKDTYQNILNSIKEKRQDVKENREALSQDLVDYYKESGEIQIEDHEGKTKRMIFSVKLVAN